MESLNVLVIDDSMLTIKKMEAALTQLGHKVVGREQTGGRALEAYRHCNPDLVTMDIVMPDVDGIEATRRILAEFPDAVIIMVTSHGQEMVVKDAIKAGARGYVIKPVKPETLDAHIKLALAS